MTPAQAPGNVPWLVNRPYFDLGGPGPAMPLHACAVVIGRDWLDDDPGRPGPAMAMAASFRHRLVRESGLERYAASAPADLPPDSRTPAWDRLVSLTGPGGWHDDTTRARAGRLLCALTLYDAAVDLCTPLPSPDRIRRCDGSAAVAVLACSASYVSGALPLARVRETLEGVVGAGRLGSVATWSAHLLLASLGLEGQRPSVAAVEAALAPLEEATSACAGDRSSFDAARLHARAAGLRARMLTLVDAPRALAAVAEGEDALARAVPPQDGGTGHDAVLLADARRRLMDRRCLLQQMGRDWDGALATAAEAVSLDGYDSRAWLQLGNVRYQRGEVTEALAAFRQAVRLGPLFTDRAAFMVGHCLLDLERFEDAADAFLLSLRLDPAARSSVEALAVCAQRSGDPLVRLAARELSRQGPHRPQIPEEEASTDEPGDDCGR